MLKAKDLEDLIGQKVTDAKAQKVIAKIPVPGKRKKDDDYYHSYEAYGLEFIEAAALREVPTGRGVQEGQDPEHLLLRDVMAATNLAFIGHS